jgi:serine/threonine protein kinase
VWKEFDLQASMDHPNVVRVFGDCTIQSTNEFWLVMEYCEEGSLHAFLADNKKVKTVSKEEPSIYIFIYLFIYFCRRFHGIHSGSGQLKQPQQCCICTNKE